MFKEVREYRDEHGSRVRLPVLKDYAYEKEIQLRDQRLLFEKLRYKGYIRRGTISHFFSRINEVFNSILVWVKQ